LEVSAALNESDRLGRVEQRYLVKAIVRLDVQLGQRTKMTYFHTTSSRRLMGKPIERTVAGNRYPLAFGALWGDAPKMAV
jgi:hypothetical protein